ncbi:hypothetical protein HDU87_008338 [Geranomyces variabilis]|uniref:Uncharacterized protein n=1 Tax=Geranomyces variabilis TaxID=109894 RepID=A0AAD5TFF1_9FUNG|nr:hypothetical protein HDU87_008338 [Geranomyces variabilis]
MLSSTPSPASTRSSTEKMIGAAGPKSPPHFGDIMSSRETSNVIPEGFSPLERIMLTANGNVQRILSAYHNAKVTVEILGNELVSSSSLPESSEWDQLQSSPVVYERKVLLVIGSKTSFNNFLLFEYLEKICCTAYSTVVIRDAKYLRLIVDEHVGIGQLFRFLSVLPEFALKDAGRGMPSRGDEFNTTPNSVEDKEGFWRTYTLESAGITCTINEVFPGDVFALSDAKTGADAA